jgi:hypothetical protein
MVRAETIPQMSSRYSVDANYFRPARKMRKINLKKKKMKIARRRYVGISPLQPLERLRHVST